MNFNNKLEIAAKILSNSKKNIPPYLLFFLAYNDFMTGYQKLCKSIHCIDYMMAYSEFENLKSKIYEFINYGAIGKLQDPDFDILENFEGFDLLVGGEESTMVLDEKDYNKIFFQSVQYGDIPPHILFLLKVIYCEMATGGGILLGQVDHIPNGAY